MYKNFVFETFRSGYCERFIVQAKNLKEAFKTVKNDYDIITDGINGNGYLCLGAEVIG